MQAIDDDCNQTGQMVAGLLKWPQGTFASKVRSIAILNFCVKGYIVILAVPYFNSVIRMQQ